MVVAEELPVVWRSAILPRQYRPRGPLVEVHLVPAVPSARHGVPDLERICDELADLGRSERLFSQEQSLSVGSSAEVAWALSTDRRAEECGLAVLRTGQRTCWFPLPAADLGAVPDRDDLASRVADRLTTLLAIALPLPGHLAAVAGLDPITATTSLAGASAGGASFNLDSPGRIRIGAEEAFPVEDLRRTAQEIAGELVARLAAPLNGSSWSARG
jgi:hypothetical protein